MKKTKTILAIALAAVISMSFVGCGDDSNDSKSSKKDKNESSSAEIAETNAAYTEPINTEPEIVNSIITEPVTEPETEPVTESNKFVPDENQQKELDGKYAFALTDKDGKLISYNRTIAANDLTRSDAISNTIVLKGSRHDLMGTNAFDVTVVLESNVDTDFSKISKFPTYPDDIYVHEDMCKFAGLVTDENEINKYKTEYNHDGDVVVIRCYKYSDEKLKSILGVDFSNRADTWEAYTDFPSDADYMATIICSKIEDFEKYVWKQSDTFKHYENRGLSYEDAELEYNCFKTSELWLSL